MHDVEVKCDGVPRWETPVHKSLSDCALPHMVTYMQAKPLCDASHGVLWAVGTRELPGEHNSLA